MDNRHDYYIELQLCPTDHMSQRHGWQQMLARITYIHGYHPEDDPGPDNQAQVYLKVPRELAMAPATPENAQALCTLLMHAVHRVAVENEQQGVFDDNIDRAWTMLSEMSDMNPDLVRRKIFLDRNGEKIEEMDWPWGERCRIGQISQDADTVLRRWKLLRMGQTQGDTPRGPTPKQKM